MVFRVESKPDHIHYRPEETLGTVRAVVQELRRVLPEQMCRSPDIASIETVVFGEGRVVLLECEQTFMVVYVRPGLRPMVEVLAIDRRTLNIAGGVGRIKYTFSAFGSGYDIALRVARAMAAARTPSALPAGGWLVEKPEYVRGRVCSSEGA